MPEAYYRDWLRVADEEALHFTLLADHLATLGATYGDYPAHNSLWEMTDRTSGDVLARMALVPRTLEARGLDASPPVRAKLAEVGDAAARSSTSSCATKSGTWPSATTGTAGSAPSAGWTRWPHTRGWPNSTARRSCAARSISKPPRGRFRRGRTGLARGLRRLAGWLCGALLFHQPQHAALDLAGGGHRQLVDEFDRLRVLVRRQLAAHMLLQLGDQRRVVIERTRAPTASAR
jgi:hypothetical protein